MVTFQVAHLVVCKRCVTYEAQRLAFFSVKANSSYYSGLNLRFTSSYFRFLLVEGSFDVTVSHQTSDINGGFIKLLFGITLHQTLVSTNAFQLQCDAFLHSLEN